MSKLPQPIVLRRFWETAAGKEDKIRMDGWGIQEPDLEPGIAGVISFPDLQSTHPPVHQYLHPILVGLAHQAVDDRFRAVADREHSSVGFDLQLDASLPEPLYRVLGAEAVKRLL